MKRLAVIKSFFFTVIVLLSGFLNLLAQNNGVQDLQGFWLGKIVIPDVVTLRMAVVVNGDGTAALNIIDQATGNITVDEIKREGENVQFQLNNLGITITGKVNSAKDSIQSTFYQHGGKFAFNMSLVDELPRLKRPQMPVAPFNYISEEIKFENKKAGIQLQGTLTYPASGTKFPAVVLLSGSGQQNRDMDFSGHKPFWVIADFLTRNGIAVLRIDDRGTGGSTGDFNLSTTGDFASDAIAAVDFLQCRNEIDAGKIGLIGHSEGGATAVLAASQSDNVDFMIALSGGVINFGDIHIKQITDQLKMQGVNDENIKLEKEWRMKLNDIIRQPIDSLDAAKKLWSAYQGLSETERQAMNWPEGRMKYMVGQLLSPWWRYAISLNVTEKYIALDCPALLLFGEKDTQIYAAENIPVIDQLINSNHKTNISVQLIEGVNHMYQTANTGSEYEYVQIEETISPKVLQLLSGWILTTTNGTELQ